MNGRRHTLVKRHERHVSRKVPRGGRFFAQGGNLSAQIPFLCPAKRRAEQPIGWKSISQMANEKDSPTPAGAGGKAKAGAGRQGPDGTVERAIGSRLRAYYDELAREPVPDRFVDLLKRLDDDGASS
jgi:hypothetical protein